MRAYSEDLRQKIVAAVGRGMSKTQAARTFDVSLSSVKRYARSAGRGHSLTPKKGSGRPPKADQRTIELLKEDIRERPDATVSERRRFLDRIGAKALSEVTMRRLLKRLGYSRKKGQWGLWNGTSSGEPPGG